MKLSVTIITLNEEARIRECLESVKWADEIVVFDAGSTDRTREIAREFTTKVFVADTWEGYGRQKNLCAARAENDWVLNVDADERVSEELGDEIRYVLSHHPAYSAFSVVRKNFIGDRWMRRGGWYPDRIVRLYNRKEAIFTEPLVHEGVQSAGNPGALTGCLLHYSFRSLRDYFKRQDLYATLSAQEMARSGRKASSLDVTLRPLLAFLKSYILKMGFLDGYYGLVLAYGHASYTFKKYIRLRGLTGS